MSQLAMLVKNLQTLLYTNTYSKIRNLFPSCIARSLCLTIFSLLARGVAIQGEIVLCWVQRLTLSRLRRKAERVPTACISSAWMTELRPQLTFLRMLRQAIFLLHQSASGGSVMTLSAAFDSAQHSTSMDLPRAYGAVALSAIDQEIAHSGCKAGIFGDASLLERIHDCESVRSPSHPARLLG
jgi:hypothetical protein